MARRRLFEGSSSGNDDVSSSSYSLSRDASTSVSFSSLTWSRMVDNFRIAMDCQNVFSCSSFLGCHKHAELVRELEELRREGLLSCCKLRVSHPNTATCHVSYESMFVNDASEGNHDDRQLGGLVLMATKLASYWAMATPAIFVQLLYFSEDTPVVDLNLFCPQKKHRLQCIYFVSSSQTGRHSLLRLHTSLLDSPVEHCDDTFVSYLQHDADCQSLFSSDSPAFLVLMYMYQQP